MRGKKLVEKKRFVVWGKVIFYCGVIFLLSHQSNLTIPSVVPNIDKLAHLSEYAFLGWLCAQAWRFERPYWLARAVICFSLVFASIYGATDEWHQSYIPGRYSDGWDWLADMCGGAVGGATFAIWERVKVLVVRQAAS